MVIQSLLSVPQTINENSLPVSIIAPEGSETRSDHEVHQWVQLVLSKCLSWHLNVIHVPKTLVSLYGLCV